MAEMMGTPKKNDVFGGFEGTTAKDVRYKRIDTLYSDYEFFKNALKELKVKTREDKDKSVIEIPMNENPDFMKKNISKVMLPLKNELKIKKESTVYFSNNISTVSESITEAMKTKGQWPEIHYLWEVHPLFRHLSKRLEGTYSNEEVLLCNLVPTKDAKTLNRYFLWLGAMANKRGDNVLNRIVLLSQKNGKIYSVDGLSGLRDLGLNSAPSTDSKITKGLVKDIEKDFKKAFSHYKDELTCEISKEFNKRQEELKKFEASLKDWKEQKLNYNHKKFGKSSKRRFKEENELVESIYSNYTKLIKHYFDIDVNKPYLRPLLVVLSDKELS
jgi:hypothetical protein